MPRLSAPSHNYMFGNKICGNLYVCLLIFKTTAQSTYNYSYLVVNPGSTQLPRQILNSKYLKTILLAMNFPYINIYIYMITHTLQTKALRSKRREVFLSILGCCYTTLDANIYIYIYIPLYTLVYAIS